MKIYTRTGDDGTTGLFSGERVSKTHALVEAYGTVDEMNSLLGAARSSAPQRATGALLETVQRQLFKLGADLATTERGSKATRVDAGDVAWLETEIDRMTTQLPPLSHFILPGGTAAAAQLHVARAVARRCEREVLRLHVGSHEVQTYLNRLSDFLFMLARFENHLAGVSETEWRADAAAK